MVGPIGCNIHDVEKAMADALKEVDYSPQFVSLSASIGDLTHLKTGTRPELKTLEQKIDGGNEVRRLYGKNGILAVDAVRKIRERRAQQNKERHSQLPKEIGSTLQYEDYPAEKTAYIIRQFKNKSEIDLLKDIYGKQFIQVSITQDKTSRLELIEQRTRAEQPELNNDAVAELARQLVKRDESEDDNDFGQKLGTIFHLGDVFVDARDEVNLSRTCRRFIKALFGRTNIAPERDEFGSYMAKAASLRSVDLSRQVGAAIVSKEGDLLSVGCNEVPKPGGGCYWDEDDNKARDVDKKAEANKEETNRIVFDFLRVLHEKKVIAKTKTPKTVLANKNVRDAINESLIGEITEYGRMVHAEMNALSDAARLGLSTKNATIYVTTFPCHNCAKHIIAAGINRIVFIEPYPKSRTELLYSDAIARTSSDTKLVKLEHFSGISPRRYRDIFEKTGKRRDKAGRVFEWHEDTCKPRVGHHLVNYFIPELQCLEDNLGEVIPT